MRNTLRSTVLAAMLLAGLSTAQAASQTYTFSGVLNAAPLSGTFSFDDALLSAFVGADPLLSVAPLTNFHMSYGGVSYGLGDALAAPDVSYYDGAFLGLSYSNDTLSFVPGSFDASDAFVTDGFYSANVTYTAAVPEPETYAMLIAGLGMIALAARRRRA